MFFTHPTNNLDTQKKIKPCFAICKSAYVRVPDQVVTEWQHRRGRGNWPGLQVSFALTMVETVGQGQVVWDVVEKNKDWPRARLLQVV